MLLKTFFGLCAASGLVLVGAAAGCSSSSNSGTLGDGGDVDVRSGDARPDRGPAEAGKTCPEPEDITQPFSATPAYKPPSKTPACTTGELQAFYDACIGDNSTSTACGAWLRAAANATCRGCMITDLTSSPNTTSFGPYIIAGDTDVEDNLAGCFDLFLGSGTAGCGSARWDFNRCLTKACDAVCPLSDPPTRAESDARTACRTAARDGACKPQLQALQTKCAALTADSGVDQFCGLDDAATDSVNGINFLRAFCGGKSGDGGTDAPSDAPTEGG